MNRVINHPDQVVEDMLRGWLAAHADQVLATDNPRVVRAHGAGAAGKVGVVTGGGSGHEPAFLGYVGEGLVDAVAIGEIFSSPTARSFADAMRAADGGAGVACLYGNYAGDNMNVKMAIEMLTKEGIEVRTVVANDDVPSAPKGDEARRRGVAGEILMWKVGGAKAAAGGTLDEVIAVAQKAIDQTRSIGIGLSACVIPAVGKANFSIAEGTMEVGIGHHGEPGISVRETVSAREMARMMLDTLLPDLPYVRGDRVAVLISGLGATPVMEQYILFGEVQAMLSEAGLIIEVRHVGNLFTSLEMMGVTLTLMKLDDELASLLKAPCRSVGLTVPGRLAQGATPGAMPAAPRKVAGSEATAAVRRTVVARAVSGPVVRTDQAGVVVRDLIATIVKHRDYLSEIDGLIGDGDHGINMAKGFNQCGQRLDAMGPGAQSLAAALGQLAQALRDDIGGSMGPLYGAFFEGFVDTLEGQPLLDAALFGDALEAAVDRIRSLGNAQVGDKTLMDTLAPALAAFRAHQARGLGDALAAMAEAAEQGKESTRHLQARLGRSARLGARSIGVLDAGATSCCLILQSMASSLRRQLSA
jgi:dihydroxyacetone kinase